MRLWKLLRIGRYGMSFNEGGYARGYAPPGHAGCNIILSLSWGTPFFYIARWDERAMDWRRRWLDRRGWHS